MIVPVNRILLVCSDKELEINGVVRNRCVDFCYSLCEILILGKLDTGEHPCGRP